MRKGVPANGGGGRQTVGFADPLAVVVVK